MLGLGCGLPAFHQPSGSDGAPFKALLVGQSEDFYTLSTYHDVLAPEPLVAQGLVTFWWHDRTNDGAPGVQTVTLTDDTVANDARVTSAMVAMGNVFLRQMPGRAVHLIMLVQSGTEPREVMDDAFEPVNGDGEPKRRWQDDWAVHDAATADGIAVQWGWHSWFAAPGSYGDDYGKAFAAYLWGRDLNGDLLTYSEAAPLGLSIAGNTWQMSRSLRDMFGGDGPVWAAMGGAHRFAVNGDPDLVNATTLSGGGAQFAFQNKERVTQSWRALVASPAFSSRVSATGLHLNAHAVGEGDGGGGWTNGAHPSGWTDEGINYRARQTAHAILRAAGQTSFGPPVIDHSEWQPDGSYMEFWSSAGPVTTLRAAAGDPALPATYSHWTQVSGVQMDGQPAERADLVGGRVRVYPNGGGTFTNLSTVTFAQGGASGMLADPEDHQNALYRDFPIVELGLPDVPGLPLGHLPDPAVLASTVPGAPTFVTGDDGPYFADPATVGSGVSAMTFLIEGAANFAGMSGTNVGDIFAVSGLQVRVKLITSTGGLGITLRDSANSALLNNLTTPGGIITSRTDQTVIGSFDLSAQVFRLWVDATLAMDVSLPANTGQLSGVRNIVWGRASPGANNSYQLDGEWRRLAVWKQYTGDGTPPAAAPYSEISGAAAAVNAHPWKLGADAA